MSADIAGAGPDFDVGARLRLLRGQAGLSQRELAARAQVPHSLVAAIEGNKNSPSIATLRKILGGLSLSFAEFFDTPPQPPANFFFSSNEFIDLTSQIPGAMKDKVGRLVLRQVGDARQHNLQILHETYQPGADTGESMLEHESHEGGVVLSGSIEVTVGEHVRVLQPGDGYLFDSRQPHRFRNLGDTPCIVISACTPPYL